MSKPIYTAQQMDALLDKMNELKRSHDALRIEISILRTLLTKSSLPDLSDSGLKSQPSAFPAK
jgi:hypothetical protein